MTIGPIRGQASRAIAASAELGRVLTAAIAEQNHAARRQRMHEKMKALRELRSEGNRKLEETIDAAMKQALETYPRAHLAAEMQLSEVLGIHAETLAIEDETNQAIGGNSRPKQGGSASSEKPSDTSSGSAI